MSTSLTGHQQPFFSVGQPLSALPSAGQMRIANLGSFPRLARELGIDPTRVLERHEIDPREILAPDHFIDCRAFTGILEDCSQRLNDSLFGLRLATLHEPDVYGCVIALCRAASTLRQAIQSFIDYIPITHSPACMQELVESEHTAELRWFVAADIGQNQQANYHATLLLMKLLRQVGGQEFQPRYVQLSGSTRPRDIERLEKLFGCRFSAGAGLNIIAFNRDRLDLPLGNGSRMLFTLLQGYLDEVKRYAEVPLVRKVENYVRFSLAGGHCSIDGCAEKLGLAVRTLQTRLSETGREFSDILRDERTALAKAFLDREQMSLSDIAAELGYAEQSSFGRAFKRWTGISPQQYRQRAQCS